MRNRIPLFIAGGALALLAACDPAPPYSNIIDTTGRGVGFSDYAQYMRAQEELSRIRREEVAQRRAQSAQNGSASAQAQSQANEPAGIAQEALAAVRGGNSGQPQQTGDGSVPQLNSTPQAQAQAGQSQPAAQPQQAQSAQEPVGEPLSAIGPIGSDQPRQQGATGVSEQAFTPQPFGAAEPDQLVERDFVPQVRVNPDELGQSSGGPNLFVYALSTTHNVGDTRYNRSHPLRWRRWEAACAQFPTQDLAQEAFLAAGGPENDPNHLDPDGDGFACWWDPAPFRQAARTVRARE